MLNWERITGRFTNCKTKRTLGCPKNTGNRRKEDSIHCKVVNNRIIPHEEMVEFFRNKLGEVILELLGVLYGKVGAASVQGEKVAIASKEVLVFVISSRNGIT